MVRNTVDLYEKSRSVGYWSTSDIDFALVNNGIATLVQTLAQDLTARI